MKEVTNALIEAGSSGVGLIAAQATENNLGGIKAPVITAVVGGAAWYFGPDWAKPAGAVMAGYGVLSLTKKVAFKNSERSTGILGELKDALPGTASMNGLGLLEESYYEDDFDRGFDDFDEFTLLDEETEGLDGLEGDVFLEESLAGFEDQSTELLAESLV